MFNVTKVIMADEAKDKVQEEIPETQVEETKTEEESTEVVEESKETQNIDHEAELKKERDRRKKAEDLIIKAKQGKVKLGPDEPGEDEEAEKDDNYVTKADLDQVLEKQADTIYRDVYREQIESLIDGLSKSDAEKQHILYHLEHSVRSTGDVRADIMNAYAIANKTRLEGTAQEALRAAKSAQTKGQGEAAAGKKLSKATQAPDVTEETAKFMKSRGMVWDPKAETWIVRAK